MTETMTTMHHADNKTAVPMPDDTQEVLDAFYVLDDMREESHARKRTIYQAANELLAEAQDAQDEQMVRDMRYEETEMVAHDMSGRLEYMRKRLKDTGSVAVRSAAEAYVNLASDEERVQAEKTALAYSVLLNPSTPDMPFNVVDRLVDSAGTIIDMSERAASVSGEEQRIVDAAGKDVHTAEVPVMDSEYDDKTGTWKTFKRYSDGSRYYRGDAIQVSGNSPKKSVELDENGVPVKVMYHRTTKEDILARDSDEIDRIAHSGEAGAAAVHATGANIPNIIEKFEAPKPGHYQGRAEIPVGKRN